MKISTTQFRWLLAGYIIVVALTPLSDIWTAAIIPDTVKTIEPSNLPTQSIPLMILLGVFVFAVLGAGLVGFVGMFCLWSPARYIYLIAVLLKILSLSTCSWKAMTGWETMFTELEVFLDGVILTLALLGPGRDLFKKKAESNRLVGTDP